MGIRNVDSRFRTAYAAAEELGPPPRAEKRCQATMFITLRCALYRCQDGGRQVHDAGWAVPTWVRTTNPIWRWLKISPRRTKNPPNLLVVAVASVEA